MNPLRELIADTLVGVYRPSSGLSYMEWAQQNVVLSEEESIEFAGPYEATLTPWHRFIFEFVADPDWRELFVEKSSQTGVTLAILLIIARLVAEMPVHVLYAIDSREEAAKISKKRLLPLLRSIPACAAALDVPEDDLTTLFLSLRGMAIHMIGGGSAGAFANKTIGLAVLDELDKHPRNPQGEADTIDLARSRIKNVSSAKLVGFSTPKSEEDVTHQEYMTGTRHKCFVPCPHCHSYQELVWDQVKFDHCRDSRGEWDLERVMKETRYECACCGEHIEERHKAWMLEVDRIQFLPTNLGQDPKRRVPRKLSLHISDLYSQFPESSWGKLAVEFIDASKNPAKLQNFFNSRMGLPKRDTSITLKKNDLYECLGSYDHKSAPVWPAFTEDGTPAVFVASDVQADVKKWARGVFAANGDLYVVDYGMTLSFNELDALANETTEVGPRSDRRGYRASFGFIDEGHKAKEVRSFCLSSNGRWWPVKGRGGIQVKDIVSESKTIHDGEEMIVYHCSDDQFKDELYGTRIGKIKQIKEGKIGSPRVWFPVYAEDYFLDELLAEKRERQRVRGRTVWVWLDPTDPNDFGDAVKYLCVMWYQLKELFCYALPPDLREDQKAQ